MEGCSSHSSVNSGYCETKGWFGEIVGVAVCLGLWGVVMDSLIGWKHDGTPNP